MKTFVLQDKNIVRPKDGHTMDITDLNGFLSAATMPADAADPLCLDCFTEESNGIVAVVLHRDAVLPDAYEAIPLRQYHAECDAMGEGGEAEVFRAFRAKGLYEWRRNTRYCSCCGTHLTDSEQFTARECPECKKIIFPRIDPCIIVLVKRHDRQSDGSIRERVLLARHVQRTQSFYACIAGFVECGETIEHAVRREIMEETGITVGEVHYQGSQSWPFPQQLMLAFYAEYESGEIKVQEDEISDAQWFDVDNLPDTPPPGSIAYRLIHGEF